MLLIFSKFIGILALLPLLAFGQQIYDDAYYQKHPINNLELLDNSLNFMVIGDWGTNGHFSQQPVAQWLDIAMRAFDGEFVTTTGDNFYDNGVASIDDPYWQSSFEAVYHGPYLFNDWYPTLGNHDYRGNWQAQIDYSQKSRRWQFPAPYYAKHFTLNNGEQLLLLFIDTSPLNPEYKTRAKYAATQRQDSQQQLNWLEQQLTQSSAKWKIVIGHHPLYSSGKRFGQNQGIRNVLEPIFERHKVNAYFAGHEHDLQHNQPTNKFTAHFVSGAGAKLRTVSHRAFTRFAQATPGFIAVSVNDEKIRVQIISATGEVLYRTDLLQESQKNENR
ncbi:metallophosphoesterase [Thalassotalea ganghwensis]